MFFKTYKEAVGVLLALAAFGSLGWIVYVAVLSKEDAKQARLEAVLLQQERHNAVDAERYVIGGVIKEYSFPESRRIAIHFTDGRSIRLVAPGHLGPSSEMKIPLNSPCVILYNGHMRYISTTEVTVNERAILLMRLGITEDAISTEACRLVMP